VRHVQIHVRIVSTGHRVLYGSFAERAKSAIDWKERLRVRYNKNHST